MRLNRINRSASRILLWTITFLALGSTVTLVVYACSFPGIHPLRLRWPPATTVRVNNLGVPAASVQTAVNNWNSAFLLYGFLYGLCYTPAFSLTSGSGPSIDLDYAFIESPPGSYVRGVTSLQSATLVGDKIFFVQITINTNVTNPDTITETVAHELGHTVALLHCTGCSFHSSVVVAGTPIPQGQDPWSYSVGLPGPTGCDLFAVWTAAADYRCVLSGSCPEFCNPPDEGPQPATRMVLPARVLRIAYPC